jgi:hypothetical protein
MRSSAITMPGRSHKKAPNHISFYFLFSVLLETCSSAVRSVNTVL